MSKSLSKIQPTRSGKSIYLRTETYRKLCTMGDLSTTFSDIIEELLANAKDKEALQKT